MTVDIEYFFYEMLLEEYARKYKARFIKLCEINHMRNWQVNAPVRKNPDFYSSDMVEFLFLRIGRKSTNEFVKSVT